MKKALSYIWPLTRKYPTKYSGTLEVTWLNGKKVLDSKNANYSYGSLEKVLDKGLSYCHAERSSRVLVLGLGGGSVLDLLRKKYKYSGEITAVEIDPAVIEIAKSQFNIERHTPLEIVCANAYDFVKSSRLKYGLVVIDLFIDVSVPLRFFSSEFLENIFAVLEPIGEVLFNARINQIHDAETHQIVMANNPIKFRKIEYVNGSKTLLIGKKADD